MNRRVAFALVLVWSASAWAQEPSRPTLSGTWTLVRSQSNLQFARGAMVLRIDQKDGVVKLSRTLAEQGRSETTGIELTTNGKETVRKEAGQTFFDRGSWEGDRLAVVTRIEGGWEGTKTAMHSLSPDGKTLTIEERFKGSRMDYGETWIFRRTDGEPSPALPRLTLKPLGWGKADGHYPAGKPILLQLAIKNDQPVPVEVHLRDHGKDGSHEPLWGLAARITDQEGKLLTRDERDPGADEWWTSAIVISDSCAPRECEMPGDYVTLAPGQTVLRAAELDALIWNCPALRKMSRTSLPAGTYDVQLTLDGLISDSIQIVVE